MATIIDPPEGWKFGFPKEIPEEIFQNKEKINDWFIQQGYPKKLIEFYGKHFYYRCWNTEEKITDNNQ